MIKQVLSVLRAFYRKELLRLFLVCLPRKFFWRSTWIHLQE